MAVFRLGRGVGQDQGDEHVCVRLPASLMQQTLGQRHMTIQMLRTLSGKKEVIDGLILAKYYTIRPHCALCIAQN